MHNGYINVDNRKMSKSLGNFFTVREVANIYGYEPIRYLMISAHYRSPINYTEEVIKSCAAALERLYTCRDNMDFVLPSLENGEKTAAFSAVCDEKRSRFNDAMDDDLNTADAVSVLFEFAREINTYISSGKALSGDILYAAEKFDEMTYVLGILYNREKNEDEEVLALLEKRTLARKNRDYKLADELRDEIAARGYSIEDTANGPKLVKI